MSREMQGRYDQMWEDAQSQFIHSNCSIDASIESIEDNRRGITLLAKPNQTVKTQIHFFQKELSKIEPNQYYQPLEDIHLTVLSIISCYMGFDLRLIDPNEYQRVVHESVNESFNIKFEGITASSSAVLIQGFPEGNKLKEMRDKLRRKFRASSLEHSIDSRYEINTAHLTIMRFTRSLSDVPKFIQLLEKHRAFDFGTMQIDLLHLVFNDWFQRSKNVQKLATFELR